MIFHCMIILPHPAPGSEVVGPGQAASWFTVEDLLQGHIHYVQTPHQGVEPAADRVMLHVDDGVNSSPVSRLQVNITVSRYATLSYFLNKNKDFLLFNDLHL